MDVTIKLDERAIAQQLTAALTESNSYHRLSPLAEALQRALKPATFASAVALAVEELPKDRIAAAISEAFLEGVAEAARAAGKERFRRMSKDEKVMLIRVLLSDRFRQMSLEEEEGES